LVVSIAVTQAAGSLGPLVAHEARARSSFSGFSRIVFGDDLFDFGARHVAGRGILRAGGVGQLRSVARLRWNSLRRHFKGLFQ